jgi:hypothetical protein
MHTQVTEFITESIQELNSKQLLVTLLISLSIWFVYIALKNLGIASYKFFCSMHKNARVFTLISGFEERVIRLLQSITNRTEQINRTVEQKMQSSNDYNERMFISLEEKLEQSLQSIREQLDVIIAHKFAEQEKKQVSDVETSSVTKSKPIKYKASSKKGQKKKDDDSDDSEDDAKY